MISTGQKSKISKLKPISSLVPKNKKLLVFLIVVLGLIIYLYLAHFFIYYYIGKTHLLASDKQSAYIIGASETATTDFTYVSLGDSLAAGVGVEKYEDSYPYLLAQKIAESKAETISLKNFSYPGARTSHLITTQMSSAISAQPDMITLLIGTNDVHGNISPDNFRKNYDYIL